MFAPGPGAGAKRLLRAFYAGVLIKYLVAAALFVLALRFLPDQFGAVLGTFVATLAVYWLALLWRTDDLKPN